MAKTNKISATKTVKELWEGITDTPAAKRVSTIYNLKRRTGRGAANWNGFIFEALIYRLLTEGNIAPNCIFENRCLALIPDTKYDLLLCSSDKPTGRQLPICISLKTSLRERYKQAEREGMIAKQVHRGSITALLTMDTKEVAHKRQRFYGLDYVIDCNDSGELEKFVHLIRDLNPVPRLKIRELGPLISETIKETKAKLAQKKRT
jgi:hypothetical protein